MMRRSWIAAAGDSKLLQFILIFSFLLSEALGQDTNSTVASSKCSSIMNFAAK